jgi:ATP-binding cassette, subfamily B, bacterial
LQILVTVLYTVNIALINYRLQAIAAFVTKSSYWQLRTYLIPHWRLIARASICTLIFIGTMPLLAHILGQVSGAIGAGNVAEITRISGFTLVMFLFRGFGQYGQDALMSQAALSVALDLRIDTYAHLHRLDLDFFAESRTGDLTYRLTEDVDRVGEVVAKFFHQFMPSLLQLVLVLGYLFWLNWLLTLMVFLIAPPVAILIGWFGKQMLERSRRSQDQVSNLSSLLSEVFSGIRLVRAFATEGYEIQRFRREAEQNRQKRYAADQIRAVQYPVIGFVQAFGVILLFWFAGWQISQKQLDATQFVAFGAGVALLIDPIVNSTGSYNEIKEAEASCDRIFELFKLQPTVRQKPNAIELNAELGEVSGKISFQNLSFAYAEQTVLKEIDFVVFPGEVIALVGASGAGKSTLINLLMRFYDPQVGRILFDQIDIKDLTLKSMRRTMAIVPQETVLFAGSIASNIAFGQATYDLAAVEEAAKIANAHEFITKLPQAYQTEVGERGVNLSGGQKQRIAIARAVLQNPKILILDEATSALDSESESLVQEALQRVMQGRTVFVIAHRLATVKNSDRIFVLEQGQIVESGNHEELLLKAGRYAQFYARQFA